MNGRATGGPLVITPTNNPADPIAWRQWHHWNIMKNLTEMKLEKGINVLTVRILTEGNMNLATLDFHLRK